nr:coagulation factor 5/8 type domain-containing protein [Gemmatimonadota bacterium]
AQGDLPMPSVDWTLHGTGAPVSLQTTTFVARSGDSERLYVRYRVSNHGTTRLAVTLFVALRPFQVNGPFQFLNTPGGAAKVSSMRYEHGVVRVAFVGDPLSRAIVSLTPPSAFGATTFDMGGVMRALRSGRVPTATESSDSTGRAEGALSYVLDLGPDSYREVVMMVPLPDVGAVPQMSADSAAATAGYALKETTTEWAALLGGVNIHVPPSYSWIGRTLRSQQAYILINQDGPKIQPGSRSYARSWIRDGALTSEALLRTGHADRVRAFLDWYAPFQYASGKVPCCVDHRGADPVPEHDSDGEFLYLTRQLYRYTGDTAELARMWPHVQQAVSYLDSLRRTERVQGNLIAGRLQFYGLLPPSISHEGYSAKPMHSYWDDFWALRGFRDATVIAATLGKPDSVRYATIANQFESDLIASIRAAMRAHDIDFIPGAADLGDFDATSTTIALEPGGLRKALPEPELQNTFDRYWKNAEARAAGTAEWKDYTPYELRTVGTFIRLGQPARALALLDFFHESQRPAAWNEWAEVVRRDPRAPGFIGDMPHTWVGSDFIRSVLDMFVYEREDERSLVLGAGVPEAWARAQGGAGISGVRTPYGTLTLEESVNADTVRVTISGLTRVPPGGILLRAPFPFRATHATVNGTAATISDGLVRINSVPAAVELFK